jgi:hypothetical protein
MRKNRVIAAATRQIDSRTLLEGRKEDVVAIATQQCVTPREAAQNIVASPTRNHIVVGALESQTVIATKCVVAISAVDRVVARGGVNQIVAIG